MATFGELQTEIAGLVRQKTNGVLTDEIKQAINDAIDYHATRRFDFNDGFASFPTVDNTPDYDLLTVASDFLAITHAEINYGGSNSVVLQKRNWSWYLRATENAATLRSIPGRYYAIRRRRIYLYPTPTGSTQTVDLHYIKKLTPSPLVADDATNEWTNEARMLIRARAMYDIYLNKQQLRDYANSQLEMETWAMDQLARPAALNLGQQELKPFEF